MLFQKQEIFRPSINGHTKMRRQLVSDRQHIDGDLSLA
jgi:hypothetical protein